MHGVFLVKKRGMGLKTRAFYQFFILLMHSNWKQVNACVWMNV